MTVANPSYAVGPTDVPLLYATLGENLKSIAARYPQNEALVSVFQDKRFTYAEFDAVTDDFAKGLHDLGIRRGDRIGIWSVNRWEWTVTQYATAKIGAVLVNINPAYRTFELEYALNQSQTQSIILLDEFKSSKYKDMLLAIAPEIASSKPGELKCEKLPNLKRAILIGDESPGFIPFKKVLDDGHNLKIDLAPIMLELDPDDDINIQYTSGTTGFPKGVTLSHHNILNNGFQVGEVMNFSENDRLCIPVPFYHCFGMVLANLASTTHGACMVIPGEVFDAVRVFEAVQQEKCTALHGVPTMFIAELGHEAFGNYDFSSLRTGIMAGAPCPIETMKQVIAKMHMDEVTIAYGQTESSPVTTMTRISDTIEKRTATVGQVMPWQELKIVDPMTGNVVPRGTQGEVCFRGYQVMSRYYNNAEATQDSIDDHRWLHSGDLAIMDVDGYVKITGRIKEMVIRGGENVYPREIEEFLHTHDKVADIYVIGVPDVKYGEELMAWVILHEGQQVTEEEMREFCKGKITHFKIPRYWKFLTSSADIPMTVTGKIQKFKMREIAIKELGLEDAAGVETA